MSLPNHSQAGEKGLAAFESMANNRENKRKIISVITQSFASTSLGAGDTWKVYLNASDSDGDMKYIVCTIDQPGIGTYPVSFTRIKEENRQELSGHIYLNTGGGFYPRGRVMTLFFPYFLG